MVNDIYISIENKELFDGYSKEYKKEIDKIKSQLILTLGEENVSVLSLYENKQESELKDYTK